MPRDPGIHVPTGLKSAVAILVLRDRLNVISVPTVRRDHGIEAAQCVVLQCRQGGLRHRTSDQQRPIGRE
jgi:hypothetical protein